jgi:hypothetical protein
MTQRDQTSGCTTVTVGDSNILIVESTSSQIQNVTSKPFLTLIYSVFQSYPTCKIKMKTAFAIEADFFGEDNLLVLF